MIWGAILIRVTAGLFFVPLGTTINGSKYFELLNKKLELHKNVHQCLNLNPIKNLWVVLKNKVSEEQPSSFKLLDNVMKTVWTCEITSEYCCKLIESMSWCLKMVIDNKSGHTKKKQEGGIQKAVQVPIRRK